MLLTITQCLKGRRMIFLGDSLTVQQADSLVGMLKWHPDFLRKDDPRSEKVSGDLKSFFVYWT